MWPDLPAALGGGGPHPQHRKLLRALHDPDTPTHQHSADSHPHEHPLSRIPAEGDGNVAAGAHGLGAVEIELAFLPAEPAEQKDRPLGVSRRPHYGPSRMSLRKADGSRQGDCWACCCNRPRQVRDFSLHRDELIIAPEPRRGCCGRGSCGNFGCCCTRVGDRCCGSSSTQLHLNNGCCGSHPGKTYKIQRPPEGNYENDRADKLFTVEVSSLRGSHKLRLDKQEITIKAKSVQEKADWLEQLEAALRYRSDNPSRVVGPPSTDLGDRRKNAAQIAHNLNTRILPQQRTNTQPTLDSWSVWRSASAAGRRALLQDDRDVAGEQLIEELAEQLRGHRGARKAYQFKDSTFGRSLGTSESLGRWPGQDWAEAEIRWLRPHEIGERGVETVPFARASVVTPAAEQFEYQAGVLEEDECYGWLAAMCGCSMGLTQPNVIANVIHSADDVGLYGVRLFVNGRWITVSIDNEFPCEFRDGLWKPLFAGVRVVQLNGVRKEELWPLILEKALAKYSGSCKIAILSRFVCCPSH